MFKFLNDVMAILGKKSINKADKTEIKNNVQKADAHIKAQQIVISSQKASLQEGEASEREAKKDLHKAQLLLIEQDKKIKILIKDSKTSGKRKGKGNNNRYTIRCLSVIYKARSIFHEIHKNHNENLDNADNILHKTKSDKEILNKNFIISCSPKFVELGFLDEQHVHVDSMFCKEDRSRFYTTNWRIGDNYDGSLKSGFGFLGFACSMNKGHYKTMISNKASLKHDKTFPYALEFGCLTEQMLYKANVDAKFENYTSRRNFVMKHVDSFGEMKTDQFDEFLNALKSSASRSSYDEKYLKTEEAK